MELEHRLAEHLKTTADTLPAPAANAADAVRRAGRRRGRRRVFGGTATAIAMFAGGIGIYAVNDNDTAQEIAANEPGEAATIGSPSETASSTQTEGSSGSTTVDLPADTGPVLEWESVDVPSAEYGGQVTWTGSSFITLTYGEDGSKLLQSEDGRAWRELVAPAPAFDIWGMQGSNGSIILWGGDATSLETDAPHGAESPLGKIAMSSDDGATWTVVDGPEVPSVETSSRYLYSVSNLSHAAVSGGVVIAVATASVQPDIDALLADNAIVVGDGDGDGNSFGYGFSSGDRPEDFEISVCQNENCIDELRFSAADLGLSDEEALLMSNGPGNERVHVFQLTDAGWLSATGVAASGFTNSLLASDSGFFLSLMTGDDGRQVLYRSTDGASWSETTLGSDGPDEGMLTTDGTALFGRRWTDTGSTVTRSDDGGQSWQELVEGPNGMDQVTAGPGGIAITGQLYAGSSSQSFPVTIEKDGYAVTWLGEDGLTVVEVASGETVLDFGPEVMRQDEAPDTVIEDDTGDGFSLTFLDPDTFEPLVTLDEADMNTAFDVETSDSNDYEEPDSFVSWSTDGQGWGWQRAVDAFGSNGWTQLAVGNGTVVAIFQGYGSQDDGDGTGSYQALTAEYFVADID